jgi:hypothetical protein
MSNSNHSVTIDTLTGTTTLTLRLESYLTPSLNTILSSHWSKLHKHKQKAKLALLSTFKELAPNSKTSITMLAAQNPSLINYDMLVSYQMMTQSPSVPITPSKSASTSRTKKPSSKSPTTQNPNQ